jgi:hypothetical protein
MKQILSVRSNAFYSQEENKTEFTIKPALELVIIYTNGYNYNLGKSKIESTAKLSEIRMIVSPDLLEDLITDLKLHQLKLSGIRKNADQINSLVRHIMNEEIK